MQKDIKHITDVSKQKSLFKKQPYLAVDSKIINPKTAATSLVEFNSF